MAGVVRIRIFPHGFELVGQGPARLLDLVDESEEAPLAVSCRGGTCGVCRVRVTRGAELLEPARTRELERLRFAYADADERLGCQLNVCADADGDVELWLSPNGAQGDS